MTTIKEGAEEHLDQPHWAVRQNLRSKFNLLSSAQQAQQANKWLIVADQPVENGKDRATTAQLHTITSMSPKNQPVYTLSNATTSPQQKMTNQIANMRHLQNQLEQQEERLESPRRVMSMPIRSEDGEQLSSEQHDYEEKFSDTYHGNNQPSHPTNTIPMPVSLSSAGQDVGKLKTFVSSPEERTMADQSQQVSLQRGMSPNMEEGIDTHRILNRHAKDQVSNASQSQLYEPMLNKYSSNKGLHQMSSKSLVNSRKVIETIPDQGYIKRSRASKEYFSLTQNMIQGNMYNRKQSRQNE